MHAIVSTVRIEDFERARSALPNARLALVPRAAGFVCAYWLEPIDGIGMSMIVFETKADAEEAASYPVPPLPGVTLLSLDIREVVAQA
jgi:hypothetical protein